MTYFHWLDETSHVEMLFKVKRLLIIIKKWVLKMYKFTLPRIL